MYAVTKPEETYVKVENMPIDGCSFPLSGSIATVGHSFKLAYVAPTHDYIICC